MKRAFAALAILMAPLTAHADQVTVETYAGPVAVPHGPGKVVALDLAAIDALDALGVRADGVPAVRPPAYLAPALEGVQTVGSLFEPDFEALAALGPDLIIAGGRSQKQVEPLGKIAPTIDMTIWGSDMLGQARARVTAYGQIFDLEDKATEVLAGFDTAMTAAQDATKDKGNALILLTNGGTVSAYGNDSRFGWLHDAVGIPEAYADITAETHGESVSFEFIAEVNPDWLLVIDRGAAIGKEGEAAAVTLDNPLVMGTTAGKKGQIIYLDSAAIYLSGGGVQSMQVILGQITEAFGAAS